MEIKILGTGSSGNSFLVSLKSGKRILLDAGFKIKEEVDLILITHVHDDHIKGLKTYKKNTPIYAGEKTREALREMYPFLNVVDNIELKIECLPLSHDTFNYAYLIEDSGETLVYITDTGYINRRLKKKLSNKNYYIIESNYEPEMLINSKYPYFLIQRILSDEGHLSNEMASSFIKEVKGPLTRKVFLGHLSKESNTKEKCLEVFNKYNSELEVEIGDRYEVIMHREDKK